MKKKNRIYISFTKLTPRKYKDYINNLLIFGGNKKLDAYLLLGSSNLLSVLLLLVFIIIPYSFGEVFSYLFLLYGILAIVVVHATMIILLQLKVESRREKIESVLPDLLQLTASNIRSGMTPFKALKFAAKKDFGPLKEEIDYVTNKSMGTINFANVLLELGKRTKSDILERVLRLYTNAIRTGGKLRLLLEDVAEDIIETRGLKRELATSTKAYTMFIFFLVVVGTPLLLAISLTFLDNILSIQGGVPQGDISGFGGLVEEITVDPGFMKVFSIISLIITSILASVLVGVIKEGSYFYGFRYAPVLVVSSLIAFFIFEFIASGFLGAGL